MSTSTPNLGSVPVARQQAPGPRGHPLFGSGPDIGRKGLLAFFVDLWREYGDIVRIRLGPSTHHIVSHPDFVRHVLQASRQTYGKGRGFAPIKLLTGEGLLTTEYERWQPRRRLVQPPFTPKGIIQFAEGMTYCAQTFSASWEPLADTHRVIDINAAMKTLTMMIFSKIMLKVELDDEARMISQAFTFMIDFVTRRIVAPIQLPMSIPTAENRRFIQAKRSVDGLVDRLIGEYKNRPQESMLLSILLHAQDAETGLRLSGQELHDEVLTMFFAGYETSAQSLTWIWYLLAQYPDVEQKLHAELAKVLNGRAPTPEDLPRLAYTRMVIDEALRLYPPVWINNREVLLDDEIDGYHMPKGSLVFMLPYVVHRHPAFWDNPEVFIPERFAPENAEAPYHQAYLPFGAGPRSCIGNHFALLEIQLVLATLAQTYCLRLAPATLVRLVSKGTLHPEGELPMTIQQR